MGNVAEAGARVPRFGFCLGRHFHLRIGRGTRAGSAGAPFSAMVTRLSPAEHDAGPQKPFCFSPIML